MRVYDRSELFYPYLLSTWDAGKKANTERPCATCSKPFPSRFPDAQYCCSSCFFQKLDQFGHDAACPAILLQQKVTE
jgi:hypothetical protein